jgi:hypothetical protein
VGQFSTGADGPVFRRRLHGALGSKSNNFSHPSDGKQKVLYSLIAAFVVGAGAALINFFYTSGQAVK